MPIFSRTFRFCSYLVVTRERLTIMIDTVFVKKASKFAVSLLASWFLKRMIEGSSRISKKKSAHEERLSYCFRSSKRWWDEIFSVQHCVRARVWAASFANVWKGGTSRRTSLPLWRSGSHAEAGPCWRASYVSISSRCCVTVGADVDA